MINRKDLVEEQILRENIRKAIRIVQKRHKDEENYVRTIVRYLLKEEAVVKYDYNSLNQLAHLMNQVFGSTDPKKANSKFAFKEAFTDLTSNPEDREKFVEFVLDFSNQDMSDIDAEQELKKLDSKFVEKGFVDDEEEEEFVEEEDDDVIRISVDNIPGGDLEAGARGEEEAEEETFSLGEDADEDVEIEDREIEDEEELNSALKKFTRRAYKSIGPAVRDYYTNFEDSEIRDEVVVNTTENIFLPEKERYEKVFEGGTLTERDLFKIFYKINVESWAGRYNNEYFNDQPITDVEIAPPGGEDMGMEDTLEGGEEGEMGGEEGEEFDIDLGL